MAIRTNTLSGTKPHDLESQMKDNRRLLTYLFINVIVSACTILAVSGYGIRPTGLPFSALAVRVAYRPGILHLLITNPSTDATPFPEEPTAVVEIPKGMINIEKDHRSRQCCQ